jgi:hypothetical protein
MFPHLLHIRGTGGLPSPPVPLLLFSNPGILTKPLIFGVAPKRGSYFHKFKIQLTFDSYDMSELDLFKWGKP